MAGETTAAGVAWKLLAAAMAEGVPSERLLPFELPADASGGGLEARIPHEHLVALWEKVMRAVGDAGFPVRAGERSTPHEYDAIGFACMTRATLGDALHQLVRFSRIWSNAGTWRVNRAPGTAALELETSDPLRLGARCGTESTMARLVTAGRFLTDSDLVPVVVRFRHPAPGDTRAHVRCFRAPIEWSAPRTELVLAEPMLALPLIKADASLAAFFERHAAEMLGRFGEPVTVQHGVRRVVAEELRRGLPSLEETAARLGTSGRTLRRRLADEGTTYQRVVDEVRCELAQRYLRSDELAVGAVAFVLGFSEPSTFHRAFKRWTGQTPLEFRDAARTAA